MPCIQHIELETYKDMLSIDAISLFKSIPSALALNTINSLLREKYDETEKQLKQSNIDDPVYLCLKTFLTFNIQVYEDRGQGIRMGCPTSGLIANAVMQRAEQLVNITFSYSDSPRLLYNILRNRAWKIAVARVEPRSLQPRQNSPGLPTRLETDATLQCSLTVLMVELNAGPSGPVPRNLAASALNSTTIHVTWSEPTIPYRFNYSYRLSFSSGKIEKSYKLKETEDTIADLKQASSYHVSVQAVDICDVPFPAKAFRNVQTPDSDAPLLRDLTARPLNSTSIRVTWEAATDPNDVGVQYRLWWYSTNERKSYNVQKTKKTITNLSPDSTLNVTVQAFNARGAPLGGVAFTSTQTPPSGNIRLNAMYCLIVAN
ncbi:unnamed protein product [Dibothriocephalus latus]|uniref:Fibronectin type-III domain-containing protein n=1 Tax=Dibothriocephalus latus TaxID=60516 RepID=A0A3P6TBB6_DIBLA|nr:unnamed protein product [Dibothriocephalus latus]